MTYEILLQPQFKEDIKRHSKAGDKRLISKIEQLFTELKEHPRTGTGKPEQLKGYAESEVWSRRIDSKRRLIYQIMDRELVIIAISAYGHYTDK